MSKQTCANCRWAKFEMTKHTTPRPRGSGRCQWPVPAIALPLSITSAEPNESRRFYKQAIWPDLTDCPVWESNTTPIPPGTFDPKDLPGVSFSSNNKDMRYIYPDVDHWLAGWIVVKNPSGDWMTLRKATGADIESISGSIVDAHHR